MDGLRFNTMTSAVSPTGSLQKSTTGQVSGNQAESTGESFSSTLKNAINTVDKLQKDADVKMQEIATGKSQNIHETMIAAEKADIALRLMMQVRNKIIDAYQEIMKMQV